MKTIIVIINAVQKEVEKEAFTYQEVIELAFGSYDATKKNYTMSVTLKNDDGGKHKVDYSLGDLIHMKEGMRINVDSTNKS